MVIRERGVGIYILAKAASTICICCRDKDAEDDGTRDRKVGSIVSWEKSL